MSNREQLSPDEKTMPKFTHKGWFMWCPIKISEPESAAPVLAARWVILEPWFTVNEAWQSLMIVVLSTLNPHYEPMFMFKVTGELE